MGRVVGNIDQERFVAVFLHKGHRVVGQVVYQKAFALRNGPVVFQHGAKIITPVAGAKAVEILKTAPVGMVGKLHPAMPLAVSRSGVACFFEGVGDGRFVEIETFAALARTANTHAWMVTPREQFGAGRGADGLHEKAIKSSPVFGNTVDIGRVDVGIATPAQITPSLIVAQKNDDVGSLWFLCQKRKR